MATIEIFVKTLKSTTISIKIKETDTILALKEEIKKMNGLSVDDQILMFNGLILMNDSLVKDYSIQKGSQIMICKKVNGGRLVKLPLTLTIISFLFDNEMYVKGQLSILIPIIEKAIVNRKKNFM